MATFGVGISRHNQKNVQQERHVINITIYNFKLLNY